MTPDKLTVHALIDPRRESNLIAHLRDQGVHRVIPHAPVYRETIVESINASHKIIVESCSHLPYCCIMEQDCYFPAADGLAKWLQNFHPGYNLYMAGAYNIPDMERLREFHAKSNEEFITVSFMSGPEGFHAYILMRNAYARFLSLPDNDHIDVLAVNALHPSVIYPFCALQYPGYSATQKRWTDKNTTISQQDVYGTIPHVNQPAI